MFGCALNVYTCVVHGVCGSKTNQKTQTSFSTDGNNPRLSHKSPQHTQLSCLSPQPIQLSCLSLASAPNSSTMNTELWISSALADTGLHFQGNQSLYSSSLCLHFPVLKASRGSSLLSAFFMTADFKAFTSSPHLAPELQILNSNVLSRLFHWSHQIEHS